MVAHQGMSTRLAVAPQKGQCLSLEMLKTQLGEVTEQHRLTHKVFFASPSYSKLFGVGPWKLELRKLQLYRALCRDLCRHPAWFIGVLGAETLMF